MNSRREDGQKITFIELFAGVGGFRLGLEGTGLRCLFANDNDKYACQVYRERFGTGELVEGDIREVPSDSMPDHDLLTAGFPCQSFSIAGKREGFQDITRGTLFFEICRILRDKRPAYLLLENVKGLLSHDNGRTFAIILLSLDELGFDAEWFVANTKYYLPQNRERVFIFGTRRGCGREILSQTERGGEDVPIQQEERSQGGRIPCINSRYGQRWNSEGYIKKRYRVRRLTPVECERLQGFPDGWTEGVSDTQRYKAMGNAVSIPVVQDIGRKILEVLNEQEKNTAR